MKQIHNPVFPCGFPLSYVTLLILFVAPLFLHRPQGTVYSFYSCFTTCLSSEMCTGWRHWSLRHLYMTSPRYPRWSRGCRKDRVKHFVILVGITGDECRATCILQIAVVFNHVLHNLACVELHVHLTWLTAIVGGFILLLIFSRTHCCSLDSYFLSYSRVSTFSAYILRQYSFLWNWCKSARWLTALRTGGPIRFALGLTSCVRHHIDDDSRLSDCDSPSTSFCDQTFDVYGNGPVHLIMFWNDCRPYL